MSFSIHNTNKANNIYVLGKDFVQGINDTTMYAEKIYKTMINDLIKYLKKNYAEVILAMIG